LETWVEKQIREAAERGEFDNLPGSGNPIRWTNGADDEFWWVKDFLRREGLSTEALLPTSLRLRKEIERLPAAVHELRTEQEVRSAAEKLNQRIMAWLRTPTEPIVLLAPLDVDDVVREWRLTRRETTGAPPDSGSTTGGVTRRRKHWWRRRS
jgi:Domain of unknown function (DUF1992)